MKDYTLTIIYVLAAIGAAMGLAVAVVVNNLVGWAL